MAPRYDHSFNTLISQRHLKALEDLIDVLQCSRAQIVRQAIDKTHAMVCLHIPFCASGAPCMVPHLFQTHSVAPPPAPPPSPKPRVPTLKET